MRKGIRKFLCMTAALALLATGCHTAPSATVTHDTLVYGSGDYTRINPALDEHGEINALIFNGLMTHDKNNKPVPCLAEIYNVGDDNKVYTFTLRENVTWHDGQPLTTEDVKFTFEAIMDPANESENAPNYEDVIDIKIHDERTISFVLSAPNVAFLDYMTMAILPKHLLEGKDMQTDDYFRHPIGTGPYKLDTWEAGQAITLVRNENYFDKVPSIEKIVFKIVTSDKTRALQLQTGELDLAQVTPKDAEAFTDTAKYTVYNMTTSDYRGILYNFWNEYWQKNADLIPAISYAIDREAILHSVLLDQGQVAYSPLQHNEFNDPTVNHYDYDPEMAEALLADAGCTKNDAGLWCRDGQPIHFTINATPGDQVRIDMAQIAAQQLKAIGLDVDANVPAEGIDWGGQECCIIGWGSPFDADDHTYKVFGTDKGANYSGYSNPIVDDCLTKARQYSQSDVRMPYYAKFQHALATNPAYTFFCYINALYVANPSLKGVDKSVVLGHHGVGIFWNVCDWTLE